MTVKTLLGKIDRLNDIGVALSDLTDEVELLERILLGAKELTDSDGGTLYLLNDRQQLEFRILFTDSLGLAMGGKQGGAVQLSPIDLYAEDGQPRNHLIAVRAAIAGQVVRVDDAYAAADYDFSGAREFDQRLGYRTRSVLAVPMRNHEREVIGVIQLINPLLTDSGKVRRFTDEDLHFCRSLASQAAVAITNERLIAQLEELFQSLIRLIATSIDEKSKFTGGHCRRVPVVTMLIAEALCAAQSGPYAEAQLDARVLRELELAAWIHDCGKLTTPNHIIDKQTKLEGIRDGIELVETRMAVVSTELRARYTGEELARRLDRLADDRAFLRRCNAGGEQLSSEDQQRIEAIGIGYRWTDCAGDRQPLLNEEQRANLQITRGTLNTNERQVINAHASSTRKILSTLPFPSHLQRVAEIAASHHERLNGKGYPDGLTAAELDIPARILAVADIFESLAASDRPYRPRKPLSEIVAILQRMARDEEIDGDILELFIGSGAMNSYAREYLAPEQLDLP